MDTGVVISKRAAAAGPRRGTAGGIERVRLHDLRHGYATTLLAAGVSPHVVSEQLVHRSSAFKMDVYAAVLPTQGAAAAAAIDAARGM
jgi:integrase